MEINIHEAKTHLSKLIEKALAGEDIVIAKAGHPLVRLVRIEADRPVLGSAAGRFVLPENWDQPLTDLELSELFGK